MWCGIPPTVANFITIVLDLLELEFNRWMLRLLLHYAPKAKMEGVSVLGNTREIAAAGIFSCNLVWRFECIGWKAMTNLRIRLT